MFGVAGVLSTAGGMCRGTGRKYRAIQRVLRGCDRCCKRLQWGSERQWQWPVRRECRREGPGENTRKDSQRRMGIEAFASAAEGAREGDCDGLGRFGHHKAAANPRFRYPAEIRIRSVSIFGFIREGFWAPTPFRPFVAVTRKGLKDHD